MFRTFILMSIALVFACPDASASATTRKRISTIEKQYTLMQMWHRSAKSESQSAPRDWRGRLKIDDLEQWAYTSSVNERVPELLETARKSDDAQAKTALDDATRLIDDASARARDIANYWRSSSVSWRSRWNAFATGNGLTAEPTDAGLLAAEQKVRALLDAGDFIGATAASSQIDTALEAAMRGAAATRMAAVSNADLRYVQRSTPCPETQGSAPKLGIVRAPSPDEYYPPASKRRDEQGAILVRAHVAPTSCATEFAVVMSSGYPELDQAALRLAEASTYVAAIENGQTVEGYLTFKVKFTIN